MDRLMRFVVGAAAGAVAALLLSPKSGDEWRRLFRERLREYLGARAADDAMTASAPEAPVGGQGQEAVPALVGGEAVDLGRLAPPSPIAGMPLGREDAETGPAMQPPPAAAVADLRAKVEETRQAVREALERPFDAEEVGPSQPAETGAPGPLEMPSEGESSRLAPLAPGIELRPAVSEPQPADEPPAPVDEFGLWEPVQPSEVVTAPPAETPAERDEEPPIIVASVEEQMLTEALVPAETVEGEHLPQAVDAELVREGAHEEPLWSADVAQEGVAEAPVVDEVASAVAAEPDEISSVRPEDVRVWPTPEEAFPIAGLPATSDAREELSTAGAAGEAGSAASESQAAEPDAVLQPIEIAEVIPAGAEAPQDVDRRAGPEGWRPVGEGVLQDTVAQAEEGSAGRDVVGIAGAAGESASGPKLEAVIGGPPTLDASPASAVGGADDIVQADESLVAPQEERVEQPMFDTTRAASQTPAAAPFVADARESGEVAEDHLGSSALMDQAEMRRRIEETRTRLKAKAFDAMTSGEAALLSRSSGETPVVTDDAGLDADVERALDRSFAPDDF